MNIPEQFCPPAPDSESGIKVHFIKLVTGFRSRKATHTDKRREVTTTHCFPLFIHATIRADFTEFLRSLQISPTS